MLYVIPLILVFLKQPFIFSLVVFAACDVTLRTNKRLHETLLSDCQRRLLRSPNRVSGIGDVKVLVAARDGRKNQWVWQGKLEVRREGPP